MNLMCHGYLTLILPWLLRHFHRWIQEKTERQTLFFTATWNANVQKIAADFLNKPYQADLRLGCGGVQHTNNFSGICI